MRRIAIISNNRNKYSETFIRMSVQGLKDEVIVYSDGYFPTSISTDRGNTFSSIPVKAGWRKKLNPAEALKQSFREHGITHVLAQYGPSGVEVMNVCEELNLHLIVHFHGFDAYRNDVLSSYGKEYPKLFEFASAVVGVSVDMIEQLSSLGCSKEKLHHIPCGVNAELFYPSKDIVETPTFIWCGRFVPKKHPLGVVEAFSQVVQRRQEARLSMIGDGELRSEVEERIKELNLEEHIQLEGVLSQKEVANRLQQSYGFIQHSVRTSENDSEGTPVGILEALSSGLPVVATNHAGIPDVIKHEKSGLLVEPGDLNALARQIIRLIDEPDFAHELGVNGRKTVEEQYTKRHYLDKLSAVIQGC